MDLGEQPERSAPDSHSRKPCREAVVKVAEAFWLEISQPSPLELYRLVLNTQLVGSRPRQRSTPVYYFLPCSFLINVCRKSARSGDSIQHFPQNILQEKLFFLKHMNSIEHLCLNQNTTFANIEKYGGGGGCRTQQMGKELSPKIRWLVNTCQVHEP